MNYVLAKALEFINAIPGLYELIIAGVVISLVFMTISLLKSVVK